MRNIILLGGSSHPQLVQSIAKRLGIPVGQCKLSKFSNEETNVEVGESVRDQDVYIIQSGCGSVNDNILELLIMISACKTASARKVIAVIPCFPYSRQRTFVTHQDPKEHPLLPIQNADSSTSLESMISLPMCDTPEKYVRVNHHDTPEKMFRIESLNDSVDVDTKILVEDDTVDLDSRLKTMSMSSEPPSIEYYLLFDNDKDDKRSEFAWTTPTKISIDNVFKRPSSLPHSVNRPPSSPLTRQEYTEPKGSRERKLSSFSSSQTDMVVKSLAAIPPITPSIGVKNSTTKAAYKSWCAKPGTLVAEMLEAAGADHIITMDLHDPQFQGYFNIPVDNLYSQPLILKYIRDKIPDYKSLVVISPDAGGAKRATLIADKLSADFALIHKDRRNAVGTNLMLVGEVRGRQCILMDDMADTSTTLTRAAELLKRSGATKIYAIITHGVMSGNAIEQLNASPIDEIIVGNTVPQDEHQRKCAKMKIFDVAPLFSEAIRRIHNGESVSFLFNEVAL